MLCRRRREISGGVGEKIVKSGDQIAPANDRLEKYEAALRRQSGSAREADGQIRA
jgi:hypothetical protein